MECQMLNESVAPWSPGSAVTLADIEMYSKLCLFATGDPVLDRFYDTYNEGSPRDDVPNYYRFLRFLSTQLLLKSKADQIISFVELGCKYGAAGLHFLSGSATSDAVCIDCADTAAPEARAHPRLEFIRGNTLDDKIVAKVAAYGPIHVLMIDSDHSYATAKGEYDKWSPLVPAGGLIIFDDIDEPGYGCGQFFRELSLEKISLPHLHPDGWGFGVAIKG